MHCEDKINVPLAPFHLPHAKISHKKISLIKNIPNKSSEENIPPKKNSKQIQKKFPEINLPKKVYPKHVTEKMS